MDQAGQLKKGKLPELQGDYEGPKEVINYFSGVNCDTIKDGHLGCVNLPSSYHSPSGQRDSKPAYLYPLRDCVLPHLDEAY